MKKQQLFKQVDKYAELNVSINVKLKTEVDRGCGILLTSCSVLTVRHVVEGVFTDEWLPKHSYIKVRQDIITRRVKRIIYRRVKRIIHINPDSLPPRLSQRLKGLDMALLEIKEPGFPSPGLLFDKKDNEIDDMFWMPDDLKDIRDTEIYWFSHRTRRNLNKVRHGTIVNLIENLKGPLYIIKGDKVKKGMSGLGIYTYDGKLAGLLTGHSFDHRIFGFRFGRRGSAIASPCIAFLYKNAQEIVL